MSRQSEYLKKLNNRICKDCGHLECMCAGKIIRIEKLDLARLLAIAEHSTRICVIHYESQNLDDMSATKAEELAFIRSLKAMT